MIEGGGLINYARNPSFLNIATTPWETQENNDFAHFVFVSDPVFQD